MKCQYFAQCSNPNETWLPLLEKAYAKAHGDYSAIEGGYGGEGIEDLTGGVTSEIYTTDILDKEYFWTKELMKVNQDFLFGCSTGVWGRGFGDRKGIVELHAYSVLQAREIDGVRLVLLKNPWGKTEWKGAWSDGSSKCNPMSLTVWTLLCILVLTWGMRIAEEWTAEWLQKLDHKFGDDGSFWISYEDLLRTYQAFDRTRLFSPEWKVASIWTTLDISWTLDYHDTKFAFSLTKSGPVVIVFSQLDERYFKGLEGQYRFELSFRVHKAGAEDYVVRSQNYYRMNRSVNVELELNAGEYVVVVKVDAQRNEQIMPVEEVVRTYAKERREKLLRIGQAYDLAHAKGKIIETAEEKEARQAYDDRRKRRERKLMAKFLQEEKAEERRRAMRQKLREKRQKEKEEARAKARAEKKAARREARAKAEEEEEQAKKQEADSGAEDQKIEADGKDVETENESATVTADEKAEKAENAQDGDGRTGRGSDTSKEDHNEAKTPTEGKHVKIETSPDAEQRGEGSTASTEPGEGAHTPTSSTVSSKRPHEGGEEQVEETSQEDEAYVTAAEEVQKRDAHLSPEKEPSTPKPNKTATPPSTKSVDIGVQTGPGLPLPSPRLPPPPLRRGPPPPHYLQGMMGHPPPPLPPGAQFSRGPPGDLNHIPPHLRAAYAAHLQEEADQQRRRRQIQGPPLSEVELTDSSDSEIDENIDDLSDISEDEIDANIEARARAAEREAVVAAKAQAGPPGSNAPPVPEEPLDEFEKDPWNAVGVFGLRVYYKMPKAGEAGETKDKDKDEAKEEVVKLRVERPNYYEWDESSSDEDEDEDEEADDEREEEGEDKQKKDKKEKKEESQVLDVDDSAKDAVGETPPTPGAELSKELNGQEDKGDQEAGSTDGVSGGGVGGGGDGGDGGEEGKNDNEDESKEADVFEDAASSQETGK